VDPVWKVVFYADSHGRKPCEKWLRESLTPHQRSAVRGAIERVLRKLGPGICRTKYGKHLGEGLFEFRLKEQLEGEHVLVRIFCHAYGDRVVLLLGGYDKGKNPSPKRQRQEIDVARRRLTDFRRRRRARRGGL